jgi:hypothetical protein
MIAQYFDVTLAQGEDGEDFENNPSALQKEALLC